MCYIFEMDDLIKNGKSCALTFHQAVTYPCSARIKGSRCNRYLFINCGWKRRPKHLISFHLDGVQYQREGW